MAYAASPVFAVWQKLHALPEVAWNEYRTSAYLANALESAGFQVEREIAGTGVAAVLEGRTPGPTVALLADMDALPCMVAGRLSVAHSCGHDANCAMVLEAACMIAAQGLPFGRLKIIFQPAEEIFSGALKMIEHGVIDDVDTLVGVHLRPAQEARLGQAMGALYHAASYVMDVDMKGRAAHAARPHLGCNAIDAAVLAVAGVNAVHLAPDVNFSVKATGIQAGGAATNVIPEHAHIVFDVRAESNAAMDSLLERTRTAVKHAAGMVGAESTVSIRAGSPAAIYDVGTVAAVEGAIRDALGEVGLVPPVRSAGGDDFHYYARHKPGLKTAFLGIGADMIHGLHHPLMTFEPAALDVGVSILLKAVPRLMKL